MPPGRCRGSSGRSTACGGGRASSRGCARAGPAGPALDRARWSAVDPPTASPAIYPVRMARMEQLIDELERSYQETQERMSDPAVYNDHREAAAAGRRLKELEGPHKLAQEWL